jgi:glycosyltransferase involved in cell wall biosynthesis
MAMGKAVLIYDVPGVRDYFANNCITIKYKDEIDIIKNVNLLLNDDRLIKNISINARRSVLKDFNEQKMANEIYNFILHLFKLNNLLI